MVKILSHMAHLSRRHFLTTLAAATLAAPRNSHATSESPALEIVVDNGGWGKASPKDVRAVLFSTANEIWSHCAGQSFKPLRVYRRPDHPQTDFIPDWRGRIRIGLNTSDGHWAQMAFQFGHEFCHALAQHSEIAKHGWHPVRHANLWFEESLCECASLFVLRRLATTWLQQPPYEVWRSYAPAMGAYASDRLAKPEHQLPPGATFPQWFRDNEPALRADANLREKNVIIARQLLPLFEADPSGWPSVCYLNLGTHQQGKPLAQHFAEWQAGSPPALNAFINRVTALFGVTI